MLLPVRHIFNQVESAFVGKMHAGNNQRLTSELSVSVNVGSEENTTSKAKRRQGNLRENAQEKAA